MGFFDKLVKLINGTAPDTNKTENQEMPKVDRIEDITSTSEETTNSIVAKVITDSANTSDHSTEISYDISSATSSAFDRSMLDSASLSEQRYAWHKHLVSVLSSITADRTDYLRHFTIYILKGQTEYKWNDEAFKAELLQALSQSNLTYIGASSLTIEIVSENSFKQTAQKPIADDQFKKQLGGLILFGSKRKTNEQKFATAIDKRAFVISELLKKFRSSTGTDTKLMENLAIVVIRNEEDDDMAKYDWIGKKFEDDLRRELANAFLDQIGSKSLQVILKSKSEIEGCLSLIDNQVYYKWGKADSMQEESPKETPYKRVVASLSIVEGTGSMIKTTYILDSDKKKTYHIGRGVTSRKGGKYRVNDIVINDKEADEELCKNNGHVSSTHADIVFKNNKFYLKAAIGGCRAIGGSPTKIVRNEKETELRDTALLYPLEDGDMIELGKSVLLAYSLNEESFTETTFEKPKTNNAMSIDYSF